LLFHIQLVPLGHKLCSFTCSLYRYGAVMDQVQGHEALVRLDDVISLECINEVARELLGFFSEYGSPIDERDPLGG
jgi:hypothetical protein